jgi:hypothetical protein
VEYLRELVVSGQSFAQAQWLTCASPFVPPRSYRPTVTPPSNSSQQVGAHYPRPQNTACTVAYPEMLLFLLLFYSGADTPPAHQLRSPTPPPYPIPPPHTSAEFAGKSHVLAIRQHPDVEGERVHYLHCVSHADAMAWLEVMHTSKVSTLASEVQGLRELNGKGHTSTPTPALTPAAHTAAHTAAAHSSSLLLRSSMFAKDA